MSVVLGHSVWGWFVPQQKPTDNWRRKFPLGALEVRRGGKGGIKRDTAVARARGLWTSGWTWAVQRQCTGPGSTRGEEGKGADKSNRADQISPLPAQCPGQSWPGGYGMRFFFSFFFLAMPRSMRDLSSPTRDWTQGPSSESTKS